MLRAMRGSHCKQRTTALHQLSLPLSRDGTRRGGKRRGAGRKRQSAQRSTPHRKRPRHTAAQPVHVTLRAAFGPLRSPFLFPTLRIAMADASRRDPERFRIVQYSVQENHVHLLVEAADAQALSSGMRSLMVCSARLVNRLLMRRGHLWADRWHGRALASPREVRHALLYVLANFRKHARVPPPHGIDPYSSGAEFDGWLGWAPGSGAPPPFASRPPPFQHGLTPVVPARTWLARQGFRRAGLLGLAEVPAS